MTKHSQQKGFTLVELAIVLTIIGLLIGGILKGQQLMTNARVTATMAQVQAIEAATTTFRDTYGMSPGDIPSPNTRLTGFQNTATTATLATLGDGIIGLTAWDLTTAQSATALPAAANAAQNETVLYWGELSAAGLLSGITYDGSANPTMAYGETHPASRLGGGWVVGNANGSTGQPLTAAVAAGPSRSFLSGTVLALGSAPSTNLAIATANLMTPSTAAQIDRKMDDGNGLSGFIQGYGATGAAGTAAACLLNAAPYSYQEANTGKTCSLFWRIQG